MADYIDPHRLKSWLHDGAEIALVDVREFGQFSTGHIFLAANIPYSRLELDAPRLIPRAATRLVLCDAEESALVQACASALVGLGYSQVFILRGGNAAWHAAGYALFGGVNVPSKTFGELVEQTQRTPQLCSRELVRRRAAGEDIVVLDGRPFAEFQDMSIPGARSCPNGELPYRIRRLVPGASSTIVINCAGRTRSLIGAQTLINLGIDNPVFALENGTQGWFLADLQLEHGRQDRYPALAADEDLSAQRTAAAALAARHGVAVLTPAAAQAWLQDPERTTVLFDVRTAEEYEGGSLRGAVHAPGGQLVQATDEFVAVRNARIILVDAEMVRAPTTASWLRQMGWEAAVLKDGVEAELSTLASAVGPAPAPLPELPGIGCDDLQQGLADQQLRVFDLRSSTAYRTLHAPGAQWSIRPRLLADLQGDARPIALIADEAPLARLAATDLQLAGAGPVSLLEGGWQAWLAHGLTVETTPDHPPYEDCIDYLFFEHQLQESKDAARRYLSWEIDLVAQLDAQERAIFKL
jgi:rhodanese-related sulfurtransferase